MPSRTQQQQIARDLEVDYETILTNVRGPPDKYGLLTLMRPCVRCCSTLRALSPVCGSTLRVSHDNMTTKGNIYVPGTYTKFSFSFSVWWDIPTSAFFHCRAFCFRVNRLLHNSMKPSNTTTSGKATDMIAGTCTFHRLPCPSTKRHVMLNLTPTGVCNTGTSELCVCNLLLWLTWWMLLYRTLRRECYYYPGVITPSISHKQSTSHG